MVAEITSEVFRFPVADVIDMICSDIVQRICNICLNPLADVLFPTKTVPCGFCKDLDCLICFQAR